MEQNRPLGWTTLEEAKMLVDAGLDPNTADMRYEENNYEVLDEWVAYPFGGDIKDFEFLKKEFPNSVFYPCWSLGALIEISVKIIENDYCFLSSAKDFAYSHLLNSVKEAMQKHDNITEATVCFLLGLLKQTTSKDNFVDNAEKNVILTPKILKDNGFLALETTGDVEAYEFYESPIDIVVEYKNGRVIDVYVNNGLKTFKDELCRDLSVQDLERAMNFCGIVKKMKF